MKSTHNLSENFYAPAWLPALLGLRSKTRAWLVSALVVISGVGLIALCARLAVPLPFTPVPVTGQSFGVALVGLLWGRRLGAATLFTYLVAGALGLPIFALGKAGLVWGPTLGYLIGMWGAAYLMGTLAERGWTRSWARCYLACVAGSGVIFSCGLIGLAPFIEARKLFWVGVLPFIPGDILKSVLAASTAYAANKMTQRKEVT